MTTILRQGAFVVLVSALVLSGCATPADDLLPVVPNGDPADDLLPVNPLGDDDLLPVDLVPEPDTAECVRGVWLLDNASFRDLIQPETQRAGGNVRSVTGQAVLTFGEGDTFESLHDGWTIITDTDGGSATIESNGVDSGVVRYASGSFTLVEEVSGSITEGFVETPRGSFPMPNVGTSGDFIEGTVGYACSGDFLTVSLSEGDISFRRF